MFSSFSLPLSWLRPGITTTSRHKILLPSVAIHDVETSTEKRARTLKHLLKLNHTNHSIIYNELRFHNHTPHVLGSAYIIGGNTEQLNKIYEAESEQLEPWRDSPGEITKDDWRAFLGKRNYQRAFIDFFEDQLVAFGYDWKKLLEHFLYQGGEPLINSLVDGLAHPLIHLGYAYELNSREVAIEALGLTACFYGNLHKYLDDPSYTRPSSYKSTSILEMLDRVRTDKHLDNLFETHNPENIEMVMDKREDAVLDHWNAWQLDTDPRARFEEAQKAATALLLSAPQTGSDRHFDFFFVHLLTSSHAVRILLPLVPSSQAQLSLVRQWWLFTLMTYVGQERPKIDAGIVEGHPLDGDDWKGVVHRALTSQHSTDAHYVKGIRAMQNAADTWGDESKFYLKAASKFSRGFTGWGGFGTMDM